jgi:hypothetical protein
VRPFKLLIDFSVLEYVLSLQRREQLAIRQRILRIRDYPANHADYEEIDDEGRTLLVHVFGHRAIRYRVDDADRHVKILEILPSDGED